MRKTLRLLVLGACFHAGAALAAPAEASALDPGRDCFKFSSYEAWTAAIAELNKDRPNFSLDAFRTANSRDDYERYRRGLRCRVFRYPVSGTFVEGFVVVPVQAPSGEAGGKHPVVIYNHGGRADNGYVTFGDMFRDIFPLASQGFVVIGSQYRERDEFGGADVDDVLALFDRIDRTPEADGTRIGMMGWSRGGFMSLLVARKTRRVRAIAVGSAPSDLARDLARRPEMEEVYRALIPNYDQDKTHALRERSPIHWLDELDPTVPILILHGTDDQQVDADQALSLAQKLQALHRPYQLEIFDADGHGLMQHRQEVNRELQGWFREKLAAGSSLAPNRPR